MLHQAYKYELKPNRAQAQLLRASAGAARFAYNWGLEQIFKAINEGTKFPSSVDLHKRLVVLKQDEYSWLYKYSKCAPQEALRDLERAWKNKVKGLARCPKFKAKHHCRDSFRLTGIIKAKGKHVQLPRLGQLRVKESTKKLKGRILSATVSREADRWFVSFSVERGPKQKCNKGHKPIGIDLGIKTFIAASNGRSVSSPKFLNRSLKKLARLQRQQARKKKGSNNRHKANIKIARLHRKIRNQRKDLLHKLSTKLTRTKSVICIEDLNVKGMMRNHKLARAISDQGWGEFTRMLEYKADWYGAEVRKVSRWFPSSKTCCVCGYYKADLVLDDRDWVCPNCDTKLDRDFNAAANILLECLSFKELNYWYPEFQGKLRLWRSSKTKSAKAEAAGSEKQEASCHI
jgi:putative transposase